MSDDRNMKPKRLLSLGIDRLLFAEGSDVRARFAEHAKEWDEIHVIVAANKSFKESTIGSNVWIYPTRSSLKALYPFKMMSLGRFVIERRGVTHITCQDPFFTGMAGVSLKKQTGLPLEIQLHTDIGSPNYPRTLGNKIRKALAMSYLPQADSIRVVSERVKSYLVSVLGIDQSKIAVKPIAVDMSAIASSPAFSDADLRVRYPQFSKIALMASRLTEEKNIALAIRAWPEVLKKQPKAGLVIVGKGPLEKRLKSLASRLGIGESIVFEPWADKPKLVSYYKTADAFLSTSLFEGYGMSMVEARAAGCRVVSTDAGAAREIGASIIGWDETDAARGITAALGV